MIVQLSLYAGAAFLTAFVGGVIPVLIPGLPERYLRLFVSVGAGLLIGIALLHMVPESAEMIPETFSLWLLAGFLLLLVLERFVMVHACEENHCDYHTVGLAAFLGLTVHGIVEGCALASSFLTAGIGPLVLVAVLAHKAPAAFALTSILRLGKRSDTQVLAFTVGVSLSVPAGMALAYGWLKLGAMPNSAGILLAISAGTFLYIAACDLLPELHRTGVDRGKRLAAFLAGVGLSLLSSL